VIFGGGGRGSSSFSFSSKRLFGARSNSGGGWSNATRLTLAESERRRWSEKDPRASEGADVENALSHLSCSC
jgi:hypothetical protein